MISVKRKGKGVERGKRRFCSSIWNSSTRKKEKNQETYHTRRGAGVTIQLLRHARNLHDAPEYSASSRSNGDPSAYRERKTTSDRWSRQ